VQKLCFGITHKSALLKSRFLVIPLFCKSMVGILHVGAVNIFFVSVISDKLLFICSSIMSVPKHAIAFALQLYVK
jgi:hypothetical protein